MRVPDVHPATIGVVGAGVYLGVLLWLAAVGDSVKNSFYMGLQLTLLIIGPVWVAIVVLSGIRRARKLGQRVALWSSLALGLILISLWALLYISHVRLREDIRAVRAKAQEVQSQMEAGN